MAAVTVKIVPGEYENEDAVANVIRYIMNSTKQDLLFNNNPLQLVEFLQGVIF